MSSSTGLLPHMDPVKPTSRTGIIIGSILAGLQLFTNASHLGDLLPNDITAWIGLAVGLATLIWSNYNQAIQVVPADSVAAVVTSDGSTVAGPASDAPTGHEVTVASE